MDDIERAINNGVNTFKVLTKENRVLPGAGATEIELAKRIESFAQVRTHCSEEGRLGRFCRFVLGWSSMRFRSSLKRSRPFRRFWPRMRA